MREHEIIITPGRVEKEYFKDIWRYRELFYFLAWRDILVRYKQTAIGVIWALLRPLLTMIVFTIVFGKLAGLKADGDTPYALMVFAGLLPWQFFSSSLQESSNSVINNANMVSKVYFPRLIIPTSAVIVCLVDFFISFTILGAMMLWYGHMPGLRILALPLFMALAFLAALGAGLWISALNVKYRDFRYIIPFMVQFGLYISPVGFSSGIVPEKWRMLYSLNPMVGVIDGFRWSILGGNVPMNWPAFWLSSALVLIIFVSGLMFYRKTEKSFADFI